MEINGKVIEIVLGSITRYKADALVCPANGDLTALIMPGGVQFAFLVDGGRSIFEEAERVAEEYSRIHKIVGEIGRVPSTSAHVTSAGRLPAKYVIHSVSIDFDPKIKQLVCNGDIISRSVENVLEKAVELKLNSVGFPLLGTGLYGVSVEESSRAILGSFIEHYNLEKKTTLNRLCLACYSSSDYVVSNEALASIKNNFGKKQRNTMMNNRDPYLNRLETELVALNK